MIRTKLSTSQNRVEILYLITLLLYLGASFIPEYRVWGFSVWSHQPVYIPIILSILSIALFSYSINNDISNSNNTESTKQFWLFSIIIFISFVLLFIVFRSRAHFLGDGYTVLSILSSDDPLLKSREIGEVYAHLWLKDLLAYGGEKAALLSFQLISIISGALFLLTTLYYSFKLFTNNKNRILFSLGIISGGYMLMCFGYVENYSIFVLSVLVYTFLGLSISLGKSSRWLIIPAQIAAVIFHIFGVTLIPATVYLLFSNSKYGNKLKNIDKKTKTLILFVSAIGAVAGFIYYYKTNFFFYYSIVPFISDKFTLDNYSMFSIAHLLDMINLLVLVIPGIGLLLLSLFTTKISILLKESHYFFLMLLSVSVLGASFIFDPKLGMARDWDLFSYIAIPISIFFYYYLIRNRANFPTNVTIVLLSIFLGFFSLSARVISINQPEVAVENFTDYINLDKGKNRNARYLLATYYKNMGDNLAVKEIVKKWNTDYPERVVFQTGFALKNEGKIVEASGYFQKVMQMNPSYIDAWINYGECLTNLKRYSEAIQYLEVGVGLSPYDASGYNNLGVCFMGTAQYDKAEKVLKTCESLPQVTFVTLYNLTTLYRLTRDHELYLEYLIKSGTHKEAGLFALKELGNYYLVTAQYQRAKQIYLRGINLGMDQRFEDSLRQNYPMLGL